MKYTVKLLPFILAYLIFFSGCAMEEGEAQDISVKTILPKNLQTLSIDNFNGNIEIKESPDGKINIKTTKYTQYGKKELKKAEITIIEKNNMVIITNSFKNDEVKVTTDFEIEVPKSVKIGTINNTNGKVIISNTNGDVFITNSNGIVKCENIEGIVSAKTSNADIVVIKAKGIGVLETLFGNIEADINSVTGGSSIKTNAGKISLAVGKEIDSIITANAFDGTIFLMEVEVGITTLKKEYLYGKVGNGHGRLEVENKKGDIVLKNPM